MLKDFEVPRSIQSGWRLDQEFDEYDEAVLPFVDWRSPPSASYSGVDNVNSALVTRRAGTF